MLNVGKTMKNNCLPNSEAYLTVKKISNSLWSNNQSEILNFVNLKKTYLYLRIIHEQTTAKARSKSVG